MAVLIPVTRQVPKECHEILVIIREAVVAIKSKGDYTALIGDLLKAVDGITGVADEVANAKFELATDAAAEILLMFEQLAAVPPAPAPAA